jgi:hypothetical protein
VIKLTPEEILHIMECAEIACANPHQLIQMIREGATEEECMEVCNKDLRAQHQIDLEYKKQLDFMPF